jgi:hypothetical protein
MKYALTNKETHQTKTLHLQKIADELSLDKRTLVKRMIDNWLETETYIISEFVPTPKDYSKNRK